MASKKQRRTAWAMGLSLLAHVLALTGMVVGLKVLRPPPEGRALELRLYPMQEPRPRPEPPQRSPVRRNFAAPFQRRQAPQPPPEVPTIAAPETVAPKPDAGLQANGGSKGLLPGLKGRLGCNDPVAFRLTTEERRTCAESLSRLATGAKPLNLNISASKKAEFEHYEFCLKLQQGPIPPINENRGLADPHGCLMGRW
jgi:hypothetical protein